MPQPMSRVKPDARVQTHWGVMADHPDLAILVVQILAAWSHTENTLGRFLAACLHADSSAGLAMYLSLSGGEARRAVLEAAAVNSLDSDKLDLFRITMKAIKSVRDRRNQLAHGLWGKSNDIPGALLLQSPNDDIIHYDNIMKRVDPPYDRSIMVFRKNDLLSDLKDAEGAASAVTCLWFVCSSVGDDGDKNREHLLSLPLVKRHLPSIKKD